MRKFYFFNIVFNKNNQVFSAVVKSEKDFVNSQLIDEARNSLELTGDAVLTAVSFLGRMNSNQWEG